MVDDAAVLTAAPTASMEAAADDWSSNVVASKNTTPVPPRNTNASACHLITGEKAAANSSKSFAEKSASTNYSFSVVCPDGSVVHLSAEDESKSNEISHIILGRGKFGIPSSASHVSRKACVLRLVHRSSGAGSDTSQHATSTNTNEKRKYVLELVVLGSQPCRLTRLSSSSGFMFVKSISQILASSHDLSSSTIYLNDGDTIEPYERPVDCTTDDAKVNGVYHPFKVRISATASTEFAEEKIHGTAYREASRKIDMAAQQEHENSQETVAALDVQTAMTGKQIMNEKAGEKKSNQYGSATESGKHTEQSEETQDTVLAIGMKMAAEDSIGKAEDMVDGKVTNETAKANDFINSGSILCSAGGEGMEEAVEASDQLENDTSNNDAGQCRENTLSNNIDTRDQKNTSINDESVKITEDGKQGTTKDATDGETKDSAEPTAESEQNRSVNESDKRTENAVNDELNDSAKPREHSKWGSSRNAVYDEKVESTKPSDMNLGSPAVAESSEPCHAVEAPKKGEVSSSSESSEEEYGIDDPRQEIIDLFQDMESPGTFAVGGSCDAGKLIMPGLVVDGVGSIGLPLSGSQARELAKRCEQAPFGRGSQTIVDKTVRNTFQLAPEHFQINNPSWSKELKSLTENVCQSLGVQAQLKVEARLYKLLLYEEGSFFAPHRDSEKEEGMFGTLIVVLPSQFTGGELVVKHKGKTEIFEQAGSSSFGSQYSAFYADCKHELRKLTSGHRLCLVYNLVKTSLGLRPMAADNSSLLKRLKAASSQWGQQFDGKKLVLMTEHLYTPAGIKNGKGSAKYKGDDAAVVELLELAIEKGADIEYDHGTVSLSETGYGEEDGYGRWGGGSFTWVEATDRDLSLDLSNWGCVDISEDEEMVPETFFEDQEPDDETFEPTGNEGVNAERQYADAEAIVVWPRSQRWSIATNNDTSRMGKYLLKACEEGGPDSEPKEDCIKKAKILIPRVENSKLDVATLMRCILMIGDKLLAKQFLTSYLSDSKGSPDATFEHMQAFIDRFGADTINPAFLTSVNATSFAADPTGMANFLIKYHNTLGQKTSNEQLTENLIGAFVHSMCPPNKKDCRVPAKDPDKFPLNAILGIFIGDKHNSSGTLARCVLEGYVWLSCQPIKYNSWSSTRTQTPEGPELLPSAALSILSLCETFGWSEYENVLVDAVEKLCIYGKADIAIALVEKFAPTALAGDTSDQSRVCARMASIACEKILVSSQPHHKSDTLTTYKKLVKVIGTYCPSQAPRFVEAAKSLDVDSILYPLVLNVTLRSTASECMKSSLGLLTLHCAHILNSRVSTDLGSITVWSLPHANLSRNSAYSSFLRNPCKQVHDWKVKKSDHSGFLADLGLLIRLGEVKAESYKPGRSGAYHFKITKLKSQSVPVSSLSSLTCSCSSGSSSRYSSYRPYYQSASSADCLLKKHKSTASKYCEDEKKLNVIKALLMPPAEVVAQQYPQQLQQGKHQPSQQQQRPLQRRLQKLDVLYTAPSLGLTLALVNNTQAHVKEISPTAPNANMVRANDVLVGVNGKRFEELGLKIEGNSSFHNAIEKLKDVKRPMLVMFERWVTINDAGGKPGQQNEVATRKRPASASTSSGIVGQAPLAVGSGAQGQHLKRPAKKPKSTDVIDLT